MSGSFESMRWNACVHRLDLGLHSHPKEFGENGVRTRVSSKEKIRLLFTKKKKKKKNPPQRRIEPTTLHRAQDSEASTLPMSYSGTHQNGLDVRLRRKYSLVPAPHPPPSHPTHSFALLGVSPPNTRLNVTSSLRCAIRLDARMRGPLVH